MVGNKRLKCPNVLLLFLNENEFIECGYDRKSIFGGTRVRSYRRLVIK